MDLNLSGLDEWLLAVGLSNTPGTAAASPGPGLCQPYLQHCRRQWTLMGQHSGGQYVTTKVITDILPLIEQFQTHVTREEMIRQMKEEQPEASCEACSGSIDLAARLLLMIDFGRVKSELFPQPNVVWNGGSLRDFLGMHFNSKRPRLSHNRLKLPRSFDAWSLEVVGGIEIGFTNNLDDHLLLVEDDTKVLVFHQVWFLKHHQHDLYPQGLVEETLNTIALLFPQSEFGNSTRSPRKKMKFLRTLRTRSHILVDEQLGRCGTLRTQIRQFESFTFWHDRLAILKECYDDATPRTLSQWWHDRRNGVQWWMFWVVIFLFQVSTPLAVIQCVEGAIQIYKAYDP